MNIVHTEASTGWGGQEIRILNEARGMIDRGHRVQILAADSARILQEAARFGVPAQAAAIGRKNWRGLQHMRAWLHAEERRSPIDVVNTHSSTDTWLVALASRTLARSPTLVRTRHISAPVPNDWATRWLYGSASRMVVTTGEALRAQLIRENHLAAERVVSIPTGIDTSLFRPATLAERGAARAQLSIGDAAFVIGIVATLRSWKGHRFLIEALQHLLGEEPGQEILLVIVGDGPQRAALETQVSTLGMEPQVRFAGNQTEVLGWLHSLDVFALPSYANEGVPQALLQAMACGLPVVTTAAGAIPEIARAEETALVVPMQDARALAAALLRIRRDRGLGARLGIEARQLVVARHTTNAMLDRMEAVFRLACGSSRHTI